MFRALKYTLGVAAVAGWLTFALSPRDDPVAADAGPPELDHAGLDVVPLRGELLTRDDALGLPAAVGLVGEHLVVIDRGGAAPFHAVHRASGRLVSFGREGEGPGEVQGPWALDPVPDRPAFWVWDIELQRLTRVELADGRPTGVPRERPTLALRSPAPVTGAVQVGEGRWLALGLFTEGRLGEFDRTGRLQGARGRVPGTEAGWPPGVLQQAYTGTLAARPDRRFVAVASRYAGRIEIHAAAGGEMALARAPFPFEPRFGVREGSAGLAMASGDDVRFGYVDVEATPARIYGLFSGRTPAGHPERPNFAEFVHVFDWDGEFQAALRLETDTIALAVDEETRTLYAVSHDPTPAVWRYRLPEPLAGAR